MFLAMIESDNQDQVRWWGKFEVAQGQTCRWRIGPLQLAIHSQPNEWEIAYEQDDAVDPETTVWSYDPAAPEISDLAYKNTVRYATGQSDQTLILTPFLADRPVITRPLTPLYVPAGEQTMIFVSSPLWMGIEVGDPLLKLQELPILRPSDTWFGASTMEGELCYASRTYARLHLENIPVRAHRAITQIIIDNKTSTQLQIERLNLPVPYLSLFATPGGLLWTENVTMIRTRDTGMATFQIDPNPPEQAPEAKLINTPRETPGKNMVIRAFGVIFGNTL